MKTHTIQVPEPINEITKNYLKGSPERTEVVETYNSMYSKKIDIPLYIGKDEIFTDKKENIIPLIKPPHVSFNTNFCKLL